MWGLGLIGFNIGFRVCRHYVVAYQGDLRSLMVVTVLSKEGITNILILTMLPVILMAMLSNYYDAYSYNHDDDGSDY